MDGSEIKKRFLSRARRDINKTAERAIALFLKLLEGHALALGTELLGHAT